MLQNGRQRACASLINARSSCMLWRILYMCTYIRSTWLPRVHAPTRYIYMAKTLQTISSCRFIFIDLQYRYRYVQYLHEGSCFLIEETTTLTREYSLSLLQLNPTWMTMTTDKIPSEERLKRTYFLQRFSRAASLRCTSIVGDFLCLRATLEHVIAELICSVQE